MGLGRGESSLGIGDLDVQLHGCSYAIPKWRKERLSHIDVIKGVMISRGSRAQPMGRQFSL